MNKNLKKQIQQVTDNLLGWCPLDKSLLLAELVIETQSKISVELGIYGGRSLVPMALGAKQFGGLVIGVEPWENQPALEGDNSKENDDWWTEINLGQVKEAYYHGALNFGTVANTKVLEMTSKQALPLIKEYKGIKVIHQDGNHSELVSSWEVENYLPLLEKGGYWIIDDTAWETTQNAQRLLEKKLKLYHDGGGWRIYKYE